MAKQFFTIEEAANELGMTGARIEQMAKELNVGQKFDGRWRFSTEDLDTLRNWSSPRLSYNERRRLVNPAHEWLKGIPLYFEDAFPIVHGLASLGMTGEVDVFVSADVALDLMAAAPLGRRIEGPDEVIKPYQMGNLIVRFRSDPSLPAGIVAVDHSGKRVRLRVTRLKRNSP
jgi:hypothetical protein